MGKSSYRPPYSLPPSGVLDPDAVTPVAAEEPAAAATSSSSSGPRTRAIDGATPVGTSNTRTSSERGAAAEQTTTPKRKRVRPRTNFDAGRSPVSFGGGAADENGVAAKTPPAGGGAATPAPNSKKKKVAADGKGDGAKRRRSGGDDRGGCVSPPLSVSRRARQPCGLIPESVIAKVRQERNEAYALCP